MELTYLLEHTKKIFNADDLITLQKNVLNAVLLNDFEKHNAFVELVQDLSIDWFQKIYQYYFADRKEKKQDFTPKSIAKLVQKLSEVDNECIVLDLCCGSGAMTIQKWNEQKNLHFVLKELSEEVVPFLLFNLAIRNISATLIIGDVLQNNVSKVYKVTPTETFGTVSIVEETIIKADTCISNPPYNIKWDIPYLAKEQPRFATGVPPKSNANYAFILTALENITEKAVFVLPNGVLNSSSKEEKEIRQKLIESNILESVISLPDKMFESTAIPTCILTFNKNKKDTKIYMIDLKDSYNNEVRKQRGQIGGTSHTNRTYDKTFKTIADNTIDEVINFIKTNEPTSNIMKIVSIEDIKQNDWSITPTKFLSVEKLSKTRDLGSIIEELNKCIAEKNSCKLTINENLARSLGFDITLFKTKTDFTDLNNMLKNIGNNNIIKENYITFTKNKNEVIFSNADKNNLSHIITFALLSWEQHMLYMNKKENIILAELRDCLLPELMSGEISV